MNDNLPKNLVIPMILIGILGLGLLGYKLRKKNIIKAECATLRGIRKTE